MIGSRKGTNEILSKYDLRAKKQYGQNFLVDENILRKIVRESKISINDGVIEIGPGIGALTEVLSLNSKKVLAYEIDEVLINVLENELKQKNVVIKNEDFLKSNIEEDFLYFSDCDKVFIISNLPYYITTPIIFKILKSSVDVFECYLMVQKEVGLRLTGKPKTKDYNALSVTMEYLTESKITIDVPRNCFSPSPNVDSVILKVRKKKIEQRPNNEAKFLKFVDNIFCMRRKTLVNNIINNYPLKKEEISTVLEELSFKDSIRSEELCLTDIINIYNRLFK